MRLGLAVARFCAAFACAGGVAILPAVAQAADEGKVVVGVAVSQSGANSEAAAAYRRGLELWLGSVNAGSGILGRRVELRMLDDESEAVRSASLYQRLLKDEKADVLIGPYGSAASVAAAAVAERARRVLLNATGAARAVHKAGYSYVFQIAAPYSAYGAGALEVARTAGLRSLFVAARNDSVSQEAAKGLVEAARAAGLTASEPELFSAGLDDFAMLVAKARAANAEAWVAFGQVRDATAMVKTFTRLDYAPRMFVAQGAADPAFVRMLGQAAEHAMGIVPYDPLWRSKDNETFVKDYRARWAADPPLAAAQGFAAGRVLEEAVQRGKSLDSQMLRTALAQLETETPLGLYKVDSTLGEQHAARPALVQIQRGRAQTIWPARLATAAPVLRYPAWRERSPVK
jgi:branched-chain amino acid transport system substrate-binding protein